MPAQASRPSPSTPSPSSAETMTRAVDGSCTSTGGVLHAAFTGKAALVMTRKGTPASTIHSLIYRVCRNETEHCFCAIVRSEDGKTLGADDERQFIYKGHFDEHVAPDRERE